MSMSGSLYRDLIRIFLQKYSSPAVTITPFHVESDSHDPFGNRLSYLGLVASNSPNCRLSLTQFLQKSSGTAV